jgi:hypothetical protein
MREAPIQCLLHYSTPIRSFCYWGTILSGDTFLTYWLGYLEFKWQHYVYFLFWYYFRNNLRTNNWTKTSTLFFNYFSEGLGFSTTRQSIYHLNHTSRPFCFGYFFEDGVSWSIYWG